MDIKEMLKFQMISRLGNPQTSQQASTNLSQMFVQLFIMFFISIIDDIAKALPKLCADIKDYILKSCKHKIQQTIEIKSPTQLIDTSISLTTRHNISTFTMSRVFQQSSSSASTTSTQTPQDDSSESNGIVDAFIEYISRLQNIPVLNLINNGRVILTYKDKPIQITKDIFMKIDNISIAETSGNVKFIKISLLSNTLSSAELTYFVKDIYANYLQEIKNSLGNKIYYFDQKSSTNQPPQIPGGGDKASHDNHKRMMIMTAPKQLSFTMAPFHSNKRFANIYGEEMRLIEKRIKFFIENRDWYDSKGIPYQLGILLSGLPGAGKTSSIRAIANYTKRHIVNVNFANITTATQLKNLFYSDKMQVLKDTSGESQSYFIPVNQRIYVLEEIDAIGDVVKQRRPSTSTSTNSSDTNDNTAINDELTLMEILTVLDGTMEIPGRIVIMTSNHPEVLDKALIRPGRIDVNVHFGYAKRELIADMYTAYYDKPFPIQDIPRLPNQLLSPAEVGQVLFKHFDAMDHLNHEAVMKDLKDTAKSLGRQPAGVTRPTASSCSAASPFSRSPEPPLPVIDPIPIDPIAINSVPINPIAINPSPIDPVPSSPIAINQIVIDPNPIRGGSGERLKGLAAEQLEAVGRVTPVFNNKNEEKINPIDANKYHGGGWKTGRKPDEMVRLFASNGAYNGTNYSEFPKMEDEHEHTFDNQARQLLAADGPAIMDRCSKTNLNGEAKGEDYDIQPLSMEFSMFDTVDEGIKVV